MCTRMYYTFLFLPLPLLCRKPYKRQYSVYGLRPPTADSPTRAPPFDLILFYNVFYLNFSRKKELSKRRNKPPSDNSLLPVVILVLLFCYADIICARPLCCNNIFAISKYRLRVCPLPHPLILYITHCIVL